MSLPGTGLAKAAILWLTLVVGQALGAWLFPRTGATFAADGPLNALQVMLAVSAVDAAILALLAGRMRARGWNLGLVLATVMFGVQTGLGLIKMVVVNIDLHTFAAIQLSGVAAMLLRDALAGAAVAALWRGPDDGPARQLRGLVWKAPAVAAFYMVWYFPAGSLIAFSSPAIRAFYDYINQIDPVVLAGVQFGRGLIWCGLAYLLARNLSGPSWRTALLTGVAFSGFMAPQLLYPSPFMEWPVRAMYMVEIGALNFVFGALVALKLLVGSGDATPAASGHPIKQTTRLPGRA